MVETTAPQGEVRRQSSKRDAVLELVRSLDTFVSAQDVHHLLRGTGNAMGLSTVYRNLQVLADAGQVDALRNEEGEMLYRQCGPRHHHHLVCRQCGRVEEVEGPAVERWADRAAKDHGFSDVAHTVEIFGTCPACAAA